MSSSTPEIYAETPDDSARINAMPMMPIEPANEVRNVRAFFVIRLLKLSESAVKKLIDGFFVFFFVGFGGSSSTV